MARTQGAREHVRHALRHPVGLAGCAAMALSLPGTSVVAGAAVLLAGAATYGMRARRQRA
jgi:hypothetical protein